MKLSIILIKGSSIRITNE